MEDAVPAKAGPTRPLVGPVALAAVLALAFHVMRLSGNRASSASHPTPSAEVGSEAEGGVVPSARRAEYVDTTQPVDAFAVDFDTGVPSIEGLMEDVLASPALEREDALGGSPRAGLSFGALDTYDDFGSLPCSEPTTPLNDNVGGARDAISSSIASPVNIGIATPNSRASSLASVSSHTLVGGDADNLSRTCFTTGSDRTASELTSPQASEGEGLLASAGRELLRADGFVASVVVCGPIEKTSTTVALCYGNDAAQPLSDLHAEVALPRYLKMELSPPSATSLSPEPLPGFGPTLPPVTQILRLHQQPRLDEPSKPFKPFKIKLKVSYNRNGAPVVVQAIVGPEFFQVS
uniref:GAE domain-containing protein n=1 Tax=Haptolina ericina TaxID=156174 RepID=A0A7S3BII8_9EUKA